MNGVLITLIICLTVIAVAIIGFTFALKGTGTLITIILGILYAIYTYRSYNKAIAAGDTATATKIVNSVVIGACFGMAIACVLLINQSFLAAPAADAAAMQ